MEMVPTGSGRVPLLKSREQIGFFRQEAGRITTLAWPARLKSSTLAIHEELAHLPSHLTSSHR